MKQIIIFIALFMIQIAGWATHNRAGEITYRQIKDKTYEIKLVTYTYTPSLANETRDSLTIDWGDGTKKESIRRVEKTELPNNITKNVYIGRHTFPGAGIFEIVMQDPNRNAGVLNIDESVSVEFAIKTTMKIGSLTGYNNTPELLNAPVDKAFVGVPFVHNPAAYDSDGDSLAYRLTTCLTTGGKPIPNYRLPPASNSLYVDSISGDFVWDAPTQTGTYNVAMVIEEWRYGVKIGEIVRDMQIEVYKTDKKPPEIEVPKEICVTAGEKIEFEVKATNSSDMLVKLTATGAPFQTDNPATFTAGSAKGEYSQRFEWQTSCKDIRKFPYRVIFKAESPALMIIGVNKKEIINLFQSKTVNIKVVAPPPKNLKTKKYNNAIEVSWEGSECPGVVKYKVFRRVSSLDYTPDDCVVGLPKWTKYEEIAEVQDMKYFDTNNNEGLLQAIYYCYRVVGVYADGALSYPSEEVCDVLKQSLTIITNVDIDKTNEKKGEVIVKWVAPTEYDKVKYKGPFRYEIRRSYDMWGRRLEADPIAVNYGIKDTTFTDKNVNTKDSIFGYVITMKDEKLGNMENGGASNFASSVFLSIKPENKKLKLSFKNNTPWHNETYEIYRLNKETGKFELLTTTEEEKYTDKGLINKKEYCYYVISKGKYALENLPKPLINRSQIACGTPLDIVPPCPTKLSVISDCIASENHLKWINPNNFCTDDVAYYTIYHSDNIESELVPIKKVEILSDTTFIHKIDGTMGGCYAVTATDKAGNENELQRVCVDMCLQYELPNVFTPDGDGINDLFIPIQNRDVEKIDLKIYNRWGDLIFETNDPKIKWDGTNKNNGKIVTEGVYYYHCDVYEKRISGTEIRNINGFVHVIMSKNKE